MMSQEDITRWVGSSRNQTPIDHLRVDQQYHAHLEEGLEQTPYDIQITDIDNEARREWIEDNLTKLQNKITAVLLTLDIDVTSVKWIGADNVRFIHIPDRMHLAGFWNLELDGVRVKDALYNLGDAYHALAHELVHSVGRNSYFIRETDVFGKPIVVKKSGFETETPEKGIQEASLNGGEHVTTDRQFYFRMLNEAFVEFTATLIVSDVVDLANASGTPRYYPHAVEMFNAIRTSLGRDLQTKNPSRDIGDCKTEVFKLFLMSYIHGWQPQLKQLLQNNFGPSTLALLSVLSKIDLDDEQLRTLVLDYFNCTEAELRAQPQKQLDTARKIDERLKVLHA